MAGYGKRRAASREKGRAAACSRASSVTPRGARRNLESGRCGGGGQEAWSGDWLGEESGKACAGGGRNRANLGK